VPWLVEILSVINSSKLFDMCMKLLACTLMEFAEPFFILYTGVHDIVHFRFPFVVMYLNQGHNEGV